MASRADAGSEIVGKQNNNRCTRLGMRHEAVRERDGVGEGWEEGEGCEAGTREGGVWEERRGVVRGRSESADGILVVTL